MNKTYSVNLDNATNGSNKQMVETGIKTFAIAGVAAVAPVIVAQAFFGYDSMSVAERLPWVFAGLSAYVFLITFIRGYYQKVKVTVFQDLNATKQWTQLPQWCLEPSPAGGKGKARDLYRLFSEGLDFQFLCSLANELLIAIGMFFAVMSCILLHEALPHILPPIAQALLANGFGQDGQLLPALYVISYILLAAVPALLITLRIHFRWTFSLLLNISSIRVSVCKENERAGGGILIPIADVTMDFAWRLVYLYFAFLTFMVRTLIGMCELYFGDDYNLESLQPFELKVLQSCDQNDVAVAKRLDASKSRWLALAGPAAICLNLFVPFGWLATIFMVWAVARIVVPLEIKLSVLAAKMTVMGRNALLESGDGQQCW